jgi:hypothetical protein
MEWLFSSKSAAITLTLEPSGDGKKLPGFQSGNSLALSCKSGETVQTVMDRFNTYRGPENQIQTLWRKDGEKLTFTHVLQENTIAVLRG